MILGQTFQFPFEVTLIEWIQRFLIDRPFLVTLFSLLTELGDATFIAILIIGFLYWTYDKECGIRTAVALICSSVAGCMIKNVVLRRRPYFDHDNINCLKAVDDAYDIYDVNAQGYSFPSGHASSVASLIASLYHYYRDRRFLAYGSVLVFLVCLSRVALGVHYPSDVLTGVVCGILVSVIVCWLLQTMKKPYAYLLILLIGGAGFFFCDSNDYYSSIGLLMGFSLGDLFESRYVRFANTRNVMRMILRAIGGIILFLAISEGMKLPFSVPFLESATLASHLFRTFRYAFTSFIVIGIYPLIFRYNIFKLNDRK